MYSKKELERRIFTENKQRYIDLCSQNYMLKGDPLVSKVKNGIILPLKKISDDTANGMYAGGVCDEEFNFIAGLKRKEKEVINMSCESAYVLDEEDELVKRNETVVFGGVLIDFFGHFFLESLSRLWWIVENKCDYKIACVVLGKYKNFFDSFFKLLEIDDRIVIIDKPTLYQEIIIPDETIYFNSGYKNHYESIYSKIMSNIKAKRVRKIYLTRTKLADKDCLNEEYFERFYKKRGYKIIAPEQYSIEEQLGFMKGAGEVVCTIGTLSHLLLFARPNTKLVLLNRTVMNPMIPQLIINQVKNLDFYEIDVSFNFLPVKHGERAFLLGPTKYWRAYLDSVGEEYSEDEMVMDMNKFAYDYLLRWCKVFSSPKKWRLGLTKYDNFDILNALSKALYDKPLSRKDYKDGYKEREKNYKKEIEKLKANEKFKKENVRLKKENERLKKEIYKVRHSKSWKITAPLRKITNMIIKIGK